MLLDGGLIYELEQLFVTMSILVLIQSISLRYASRSWDFGWIIPSIDGKVHCWLCDPYTLKFRREQGHQGHYAIRWFIGKSQ